MEDFEQHRAELTNYCRRRGIPNPEDVVQDTFVRGLEYLHSYTPGTNLRAWLYSIMLRTIVPNRARKAAKEENIWVSVEEVWVETTDAGPEMLREVQEVLEAIDNLPNMYREILTLRMLEEMSFNEIVDLLEIPLGTALSRAHRGKQILRERLGISR